MEAIEVNKNTANSLLTCGITIVQIIAQAGKHLKAALEVFRLKYPEHQSMVDLSWG